jgi:hypothetical protein
LLKSFEIFFKAHLSQPRKSWIDGKQKGARHAPRQDRYLMSANG